MIPIEEMTDDQFQQYAFDILGTQLGPYGLARFMRLNSVGTGDYTRDRHKWLGGVTIDEILRRSRERNAGTAADREAS
jgi:hypothetical protein